MSIPVIAFFVSVFVLRYAVRKRRPSVILAASMYSRRIPLQVVPHRDLARLAAFLGEPERILRPVVLEALEGQLGDGADAGRRVDEHREDGAVPEAHQVRDVD